MNSSPGGPLHFFNGRFVAEGEISLSPRDLGFSRGYAVFDFLRTYPHHRPFKLGEHVGRLFASANLIGLAMPWTTEQVEKWVAETLAVNTTPYEKFIKIIVSGGISDAMYPAGDPTIVILVDPAIEYPREQYEKGVGVILVRHERYNFAAKTNNYIEGVKQTQHARAAGAVEPVYYSDSQVFEGSNSNIFAVVNGALQTPASNVLAGITRATLLEILRQDMRVEARDFGVRELLDAREVFLTGSGKGVVPVVSIDGKPVGDGQVGPVTREVMDRFEKYTLSDVW
ncbi:MAG: aminotransferase class IV [Patescibacteria group bacterium]